jgi:hypothetical protein
MSEWVVGIIWSASLPQRNNVKVNGGSPVRLISDFSCLGNLVTSLIRNFIDCFIVLDSHTHNYVGE